MRLNDYIFGVEEEGKTIFRETGIGIRLHSLFGLTCEGDVINSASLQLDGFIHLTTSEFDRGGNVPVFNKCIYEEDRLGVLWSQDDAGLELESHWRFCNKTGVFSRKDSIKNSGEQDVTVLRCLERFMFTPGIYEVYSQGSSWCDENRGHWQELQHGSLTLSCEGGRTTQGSTPYVCIKRKESGNGVVFHIIPKGNWVIKVHAQTSPGDSQPYAVIELGLADENLHLCLKPDQKIELPEIFIQELLGGDPRLSAPRLHRYLIDHLEEKSKRQIPLVYNTWFDVFDCLDAERLEKQLKAAKKVGCDVFTVDAGWYGAGTGDWFARSGDWRERTDGAFHGNMKEFIEKVHAAGLAFGLWMEPERIGPQAPVLKEHPGWFIAGDNGYFYPDLAKDEVYSYILFEISRLIEKYSLEWMKLDFNFSLGIDPHGSEFFFYYDAWFRLLDEIRKKNPGVFIEGCASGGMRLDIASLMHCDAHFMSDNVNPSDVLYMLEGAMLRLPPGRLIKWVVLKTVGNSIPKYGKTPGAYPYTVITPLSATYDAFESVYSKYAILAAMPGILGLSGDIAELPDEIQVNIKTWIKFYKKYRELLYNSIGYLLTPLLEQKSRNRWIALQMQHYKHTDSILFIYRLGNVPSSSVIKPCELEKKQSYRVEYPDERNCTTVITGKKLMEEGINVEISNRFDACAVVLTAIRE